MNIEKTIKFYVLIIASLAMSTCFAQPEDNSTSKTTICIAPTTITTSLNIMNNGIIQDNTGKITAWIGSFIAKSIPTVGDKTNCDKVSPFISKTVILPAPQGSVTTTNTAKFIGAYGIVANMRSMVKILWVNKLVYEAKNGKKITLIPIKSPMIPIGMKGNYKPPLNWAPDIEKTGSNTIDWHCTSKQCAIAYTN